MAEEGRPIFMQVDEETVDNLVFARENMEKDWKLHPQNLSDVIAILLNYWFKGKREG